MVMEMVQAWRMAAARRAASEKRASLVFETIVVNFAIESSLGNLQLLGDASAVALELGESLDDEVFFRLGE